MTPEMLSLLFFILEEAIKEEPAIAADLQSIFSKASPTAADWAALRAKVTAKGYGDYVPDSALPPDGTAAPAVAIAPPAAAPPPVAIYTGQATDPHTAS